MRELLERDETKTFEDHRIVGLCQAVKLVIYFLACEFQFLYTLDQDMTAYCEIVGQLELRCGSLVVRFQNPPIQSTLLIRQGGLDIS